MLSDYIVISIKRTGLYALEGNQPTALIIISETRGLFKNSYACRLVTLNCI